MTALALFPGAALPAHIAALGGAASPLWDDGGAARNSIDTTGGKFRAVIKGKPTEKKFDTLDVVVVGEFPPGRATGRVFYAAAYSPTSKPVAPDCASDDGVAPRADSAKRQHATCAGCPQNIRISDDKGAACRYSKLLAVTIPASPAPDELWDLRLSAQGIFADTHATEGHAGYSDYKRTLGTHSLSADLVLSRLSFPDGGIGGVRFAPVSYLDEASAAKMRAISQAPETAAFIAPRPIKAAPVASVAPVAPVAAPAAPVAPVAAPAAPVAPVAAPVVAKPAKAAKPVAAAFGADSGAEDTTTVQTPPAAAVANGTDLAGRLAAMFGEGT